MSFDEKMIEPAVFRGEIVEEVDIPMRAQTSNLNEELGEVEYIFSDKTGTLTCNIMEFKKFSAGVIKYGQSEQAPEAVVQQPNVNFYDPRLEEILAKSDDDQDKKDLVQVILALSTCHTVIWDEKKQQYTSSSPDELALVNAAKQFGYKFLGKNSEDVLTVETPLGQK